MASQLSILKPKVYRLRNLPAHADRQLAAEILSESLGDIAVGDLQIASLARAAQGEWSHIPTKTATLTFKKTPSLIASTPESHEWSTTVSTLAKPLILDDHFQGITPLNEVPNGDHTHDCLVLSGLASHPFGSWQPRRDNDKSFMWIRDDLPLRFPGIRFILYGYDTKLVASKSFQTVFDLANALIQTLKGMGWATRAAKDVLFLTHSLGGVILKKAFIMLAGAGIQEQAMLARIKGALFFGVPSQAMGIQDIQYMIKGQPNEVLVEELANDAFFTTLEAQFDGITFMERTSLFWAFETKVTSTIIATQSHAKSSYQVDKPSARAWDNNAILESIASYAIERDRRLEGIDVNLKHTFDWAFDNDSGLDLVQWLQDGKGLFWICGKPASGKSTFVKFLFRDSRTHELLRATERRTRTRLVVCHFFFHHRGSRFQKSFEGLLASVISQILESQQLLIPLLRPIFENEYHARIKRQGLSADLHSDLLLLLESCDIIETADTARLLDRMIQSRQQAKLGVQDVDMLLNSVGLRQLPEEHKHADRNKVRADGIHGIVSAENRRQQIRRAILKEIWTEQTLEEALQTLSTQTEIDMDLVLFLDALDEYAGRPEFIASTVKQMVQSPASSRTRIRAIFSSRPGPVFEKQFAGFPRIQVQDHTAGDIFEYCAESISATPAAQAFIPPLIPTIVDRARGVFLWVTLVMRDLSMVADSLELSAITDTDLPAKFKQVLDSLPDELDTYYRDILERTSMSTRWHTYVLLETVRRSEEPLTLQQLRVVLEWSPDFVKTRQVQTDRSGLTGGKDVQQFRYLPEQLLATATGGLVEVTPCSDGTKLVEFAHQTVKEFAELSDFKALVLGKSRAALTAVNGYSFLANLHYALLGLESWVDTEQFKPIRTKDHIQAFIRYARMAEKTTGISQLAFFTQPEVPLSSFPWVVRPDSELPEPKVPSMMALAIKIGLRLLLKDICDATPTCVDMYPGADDQPALLDYLYDGYCQSSVYEIDEATDIAKLLVRDGGAEKFLRHEKERFTLESSFLRMADQSPDDDDDITLRYPKYLKPERTEGLNSLAYLLLKAVRVCPTRPEDHKRLKTPQRQDKDSESINHLLVDVLHRCGPPFVALMLEHNCSPNAPLRSSSGETYTPLDTLLARFFFKGWESAGHESWSLCWETCKLLVEAGGMLRKTSKNRWAELMKIFKREGLETELFDRAGCPKWYKDSKAKRVSRWMGVR